MLDGEIQSERKWGRAMRVHMEVGSGLLRWADKTGATEGQLKIFQDIL